MKEKRFPVKFDLVTGLVAQATVKAQGPTGEQSVPLAAFFAAARSDFTSAVTSLRGALDTSPLASVVAEHVLKEHNKRGMGRIVVEDDGSVWCVLERKTRKARKAKADGDGTKAERTPGIQQVSLDSLREEAAALGVDIAPFGRQKKALQSAIDEAKAKGVKPATAKATTLAAKAAAAPAPAAKKAKAAEPAPAPVKASAEPEDEEDINLEDLEDDEDEDEDDE